MAWFSQQGVCLMIMTVECCMASGECNLLVIVMTEMGNYYEAIMIGLQLSWRDSRSKLSVWYHDCEMSKSVEISVNCGVRVLRARGASLGRVSIFSVSPQSRSLFFSLPPDVLFHCSRVLGSAKFGLFCSLSEARNFIVTVITGSPSSKFEHRRASALLRNIQNIRICMGKNLSFP